jgi:hypothetical protein
MAEVDLNFLATQGARIIMEVGYLRDENRVLSAMVERLQRAQEPTLEQMSALQRLITRLDQRSREGLSAEQVDAIANALLPRLLHALTELLSAKLLPILSAQLKGIDTKLSAINERGAAGGDAGGGSGG